jgi:hypothetical protein
LPIIQYSKETLRTHFENWTCLHLQAKGSRHIPVGPVRKELTPTTGSVTFIHKPIFDTAENYIAVVRTGQNVFLR